MFTDGSVIGANTVDYLGAAIGIMFVNPTMPASKLIKEYTAQKELVHTILGAIRVHSGCLGGDLTSSARAELVAAILTMTATEAIDIGTDSNAVVMQTKAFNSTNRHDRTRPLNLVKNGDLWELYLEVRAWRDSITDSTSI